MKRLLTLLLLIVSISVFGQKLPAPSGVTPLTQFSFYAKTGDSTLHAYSGSTWLWWKILSKQQGDALYAPITGGSYVPLTRTLTINGATRDLSANRTWNVGTVLSVGTGYGLSGGTITSSGTIALDTATVNGKYIRNSTSLQTPSNFNLSGTGKMADMVTKFPVSDVRAYGTISQAVTAIGTDSATLLIPTPQTVSVSDTIPSNITLKVLQGGVITVSSGQVLTINGGLEAPLNQIFAGSGTVVFQRGSVELAHPEWWYTGSGTWHTAINQAMVSTAEKGIPVQLSGKTYATTGTITVGADNVLQGVQGRYTGTVIDYSGSTSAVTVADDYNFGTVKKIAITGGTTATAIGILVARPYTLLEDIFIYDFAGEAGIKVTDSASTSGGYLSRLNRITIYGNAPGVASLGDLKFGVWFSSQANAVSLSEFSANFVGTSGGAGIYIDGGVGISLDNINIENGYSGSFTVHGILVNGGSAITLHDPYFENNNKNLVVNNGSAIIIDNIYVNGYGQSSVGLQINNPASTVTVRGGAIASVAGTGTDIELVGSPTGVQLQNIKTDDATYTGTPLVNLQSASKLDFNGLTTFTHSGIVSNFNRSVNGGAVIGLQIQGVDKAAIEYHIDPSGTGVGTTFNLRNSEGSVGLFDQTGAGVRVVDGETLLQTVTAGTADYDKFLVEDTDTVKYRTGAQVLSDIGGAPLASPTFTGTVTIPTPFLLGATSMTATGTQLNYLNAATGTTGTTSTNLVFSTSPTLTTPNIGAATFSTLTGGTASTITFANTSAGGIQDAISIRNGGTTAGTGNRINFITGTATQSARINSVLTSSTAADLVFSTMTGGTLAEAGRFLGDKTLSLAGGVTGTTGNFTSTLGAGATTIDAGNGNQLTLDNAGERFTQITTLNNGSQKASQFWDNTNTYYQIGTDVASSTVRVVAQTNGVELANGATSWSAISDLRQKKIIRPITDALATMRDFRTVIGRYKTDNKKVERPFLIAQDVQKTYPYAVTVGNDEDKTLRLSYTELIPLMIKAIQELEAKNTALESRIKILENK